MTGEVALIFIYNHRYDSNIAVLENMYKGRFSNIYHLVPFYNGEKKNVIPVYENSFFFQGYMAQGLRHFYKLAYDHYIFLADDLILNPLIDENNYKQHFKLESGSCFIPEIFTLDNFTNTDTLRFTISEHVKQKKSKLYWWRNKDLIKYKHKVDGLENSREMPSRAEAKERIRQHGFDVKSLSFADIYGYFPVFPFKKEKFQQALRFIYRIKTYWKKFHLDYPMVASYSDIVIVSRNAIQKFCHYCGVFASNRLFVECAIPTALLLANDEKVITEKEINIRGMVLWNYTPEEAEQIKMVMQPYQFDLQQLMEKFPAHLLYIHPVKLSQWKSILK